MNNLDALILCGGKGQRLQSVVSDRPKPMAEIGEKPFMDLLISYLSSYGITRFILCTGHMSGFIKEYYTARPQPGIQVEISEENQPLGTGGAVKNAERFIQNEPFLVLNGDSFCPADIDAFYRFHQQKRAHLSLVISQMENTASYGTIEIDDHGCVTAFQEKKETREKDLFINAGIYLFNRSILDVIPPDMNVSLEHHVFPAFIGKPFYAFRTDAYCHDIGTPERYEEAVKRFASY